MSLVASPLMPTYRLVPLILLSPLLLACSGGDTEPTQPATTLPISTSSSVPPSSIRVSCAIVAQRTVRLKAQLGGALQQVKAALGQRVSVGEVLAQLDTRDVELELERLRLVRAQLHERRQLLKLQLSKAQADWAALRSLYAPGAVGVAREAVTVAERESELRLIALQESELDVQQARALRQVDLSFIRSPMRGQVLSRNAEVGMVVAPGAASFNGTDVLFEVGDPQQLKAECAVREADASKVVAGARMTLHLDVQDPAIPPIETRVTGLAPAIANTGGVAILGLWAHFERPAAPTVLPGMRATALITVSPPSTR